MGWSYIHVRWVKIWEGYLRSKESQPHTRPPAQGSNARKIRPHNFQLLKRAGIESVEEISSPSQFLLKNPHMELLRFTGLGKSYPQTCQQQSRLNYKRRVYSAHTKGTPRVYSLGDGEAVILSPTGHLLLQATLPRQGVIAALPNTQK